MTAVRSASAALPARPEVDDDLDLLRGEQIAVVDLLDRVLGRGVALTGDLTISLAEVDLVHISLRALITGVRPDLGGLLPYPAATGEVAARSAVIR